MFSRARYSEAASAISGRLHFLCLTCCSIFIRDLYGLAVAPSRDKEVYDQVTFPANIEPIQPEKNCSNPVEKKPPLS